MTTLLIASTLLLQGAQATSITPTWEIGKSAPAFTAPSADGKTVSLSDFNGKYVVLEWTNSGCPVVQRHYQGNMQALQKEAAAKGITWVAICSSAPGKQGNMSGAEHLQHMKSVGGTPKTVLLDADGTIGRSYGAKTTPQMVLIDPKGVLLYNGAIDDAPNGDAAKAKNYIKSAWEEALAGKPVTVTTSRPYGCGIKY